MNARRSSPAIRLGATILVFGALWGMAEGMWLVAPKLVATQRIAPRTPSQWLVLEADVIAVCALIGAVMSSFSGVAILAWPLLRRRPYRDATWAAALIVAAALPVVYFAASAFVELQLATHPPPWSRGIVAAAALWGLFAAVSTLAYRRIASLPTEPRLATLAAVLMALTAAGGLTLYARASTAPADPADSGPLTRVAARGDPRAPLVFIGIDSGNLDTLRPLIAAGRLPTFAQLVATGAHGDVHALWPPYWSGPAWAAIVTGHPREEVGIWTDLVVEAPGLPLFDALLRSDTTVDPFFVLEWALHRRNVLRTFPPPRAALRRPPIWELVSHAGVETGVVRFPFTYPAGGPQTTAYVVSDRVGRDAWDLVAVSTPDETELVAPASMRAELLAPFDHERLTVPGSFADLYGEPIGSSDPGVPLALHMLATGLDIDARTVDAAERVLHVRPNLPFLAVYLGGFDNACHAFWPYRFPEAYAASPPAATDVAKFHDVLDKYLEFLDREIGGLLAAYTVPPNVIVVSDHGHEVSRDQPLWPGWHGPVGIFIAAGPDFPHRDAALDVSYYDVAPTIADVLGFAAPPGMHGASLRNR